MHPDSQSSASQNLSQSSALPHWWPIISEGYPMTHMYRLLDNVNGQEFPSPASVLNEVPVPAAGEPQVQADDNPGYEPQEAEERISTDDSDFPALIRILEL